MKSSPAQTIPSPTDAIFINEPSKLLPPFGNTQIFDTLTEECKQLLIHDILQENYIRIFIYGAAGMGEEKVIVNIYKYLRNINYKGFIQLVCKDNDIVDASSLLGASLLTDKEMELISVSDYKNDTFPHCKYGFSNMLILREMESTYANVDILIEMDSSPIQPIFKLVYPEIKKAAHASSDIEPTTAEQTYFYSGIGMIPPTIQHTVSENLPTHKKQIIDKLLNLPSNTDLVSIYGLNEIFIAKGNCNPAVIINNLCQAYQATLKKKKVVFLLFNEFKKETLDRITEKLEQTEAANAIFFNMTETTFQSTLIASLENQKTDNIILYFGNMDALTFDSLVAKSKLFIAEGKSALSLAIGLKVPFLHSGSRGKASRIHFYRLAPKETEAVLINTTFALAFGSSNEEIEIVSRYLNELTVPSSDIAQFYLHMHIQAKEMNPLLHGLQIINANKYRVCLLGKNQLSLEDSINNRVYFNSKTKPGYNNFLWQVIKEKDDYIVTFLAYDRKNNENVGVLKLKNNSIICIEPDGFLNILEKQGIFEKMVFNLDNTALCPPTLNKQLPTSSAFLPGKTFTKEYLTPKVGLLLAGSSISFFGHEPANFTKTCQTLSYDPYLLGACLIAAGIICISLLWFLINTASTIDNKKSFSGPK